MKQPGPRSATRSPAPAPAVDGRRGARPLARDHSPVSSFTRRFAP